MPQPPLAILIAAASLQLMLSHPLSSQPVTQHLADVVDFHAPLILAETFNGFGNLEAADHLLSVDFDCDQNGANNPSNIYTESSICDARPVVYFSIAETGSASDGYYFIGFYFYHPRQPVAPIYGGAFGYSIAPHDHDLEGVWFVVQKSAYSPYGMLVGAVSQAHGALIPFGRRDGTGNAYLYNPVEGGAGFINFWYHAASAVSRPVVAIRSASHGTFMAQDYLSDDNTSIFWSGGYIAGRHGIDQSSATSSNPGVFRAVIHADSDALVYAPLPVQCLPAVGCVATRLGPSVRSGSWNYELRELASSPLWIRRSDSGALLTGPLLGIGAGQFGLSFFAGPPGSTPKAKPVWNWMGGRGEYAEPLEMTSHWYSFASDRTSSRFGSIWWPSTVPGRLLTDPQVEASRRFWGLPNILQGAKGYNPYGWHTQDEPPPEECVPTPPELQCVY